MGESHGYPDDLIERFWSKVDKQYQCECHSWNNRCWIWTGSLFTNKYGQFYNTLFQRSYHAHRFALEVMIGKLVPSYLQANHLRNCRLRHCVRHVKCGTQIDNMRDSIIMKTRATGERNGTRTHPEKLARGERNGAYTHPEKRVHQIGETNGMSKYTEKDIHNVFILYNAGYSRAYIKRIIGISYPQMCAVLKGQSWYHIWEQYHGK